MTNRIFVDSSNDAIIPDSRKLHETKLASHDSRFMISCKSENIE